MTTRACDEQQVKKPQLTECRLTARSPMINGTVVAELTYSTWHRVA